MPDARGLIRGVQDLRLDASQYSSATAHDLYVDPPEGLPNPTGNTLIVGPMGAGKSIMLRALQHRWTRSDGFLTVYVDLSHWIAQIAGETETYLTDRLTPRARLIRDALALSISLGLIECAASASSPDTLSNSVAELLRLFNANGFDDGMRKARRAIRRALIADEPFPSDVAGPYGTASLLGQDIQAALGLRLVLLVDQIDQVSAVFFPPIASLLRRSSSFISLLCTRPCPTAPLREQVPADVVDGDSYLTLELGRTSGDTIPTSFVEGVIRALPLDRPFADELVERAGLLANFVWPSLRSAIQTALGYVARRQEGMGPGEAWYAALSKAATGYEKIVENEARLWCNSPTQLIADWRLSSLRARGEQGSALGRTELQLQDPDLLQTEQPSPAERLFRILLKKGVLFVPSHASYQLGSVPSVFEVPPLLLVNEPGFDTQAYDPKSVLIRVSQEKLKSWTRRGGVPPKTRKMVFVSFWMSDPAGEGESVLASLIQQRFRQSVDVSTGHLTGSPRWSPAIIKKIQATDLLACDLSVPRRDIFVEYGVAIGVHVPVIQCRERGAHASSAFPQWLENRQFQFFAGSSSDDRRLETSIASLLDKEPDPVQSWKRDSEGFSVEAAPEYRELLYVGPELPASLWARIRATCDEQSFSVHPLRSEPDTDNLEEGIKLMRASGTAILGFDGTSADYLTSTLAGLLVSRHQGHAVIPGLGSPAASRRFDRKLFLLALASDLVATAPGLIRTHPRATACQTGDELVGKLRAHIQVLTRLGRQR